MAGTERLVYSSNGVCTNLGRHVHRWIRSRVSYPAAVSHYRANVSAKFSLGDRHGENILFDSTTGDTVHVDFNCLFEKVRVVLPMGSLAHVRDAGQNVCRSRTCAFPTDSEYGRRAGSHWL